LAGPRTPPLDGAGINALEAMILSFNGINSLRQHIRGTARVHGSLRTAAVRPPTLCRTHSRQLHGPAEDNAYLGELKEKALDCFVGAAVATGARLNMDGRACVTSRCSTTSPLPGFSRPTWAS